MYVRKSSRVILDESSLIVLAKLGDPPKIFGEVEISEECLSNMVVTCT